MVILVDMVRRSWIWALFLKVELDGIMFVPVFMSIMMVINTQNSSLPNYFTTFYYCLCSRSYISYIHMVEIVYSGIHVPSQLQVQ